MNMQQMVQAMYGALRWQGYSDIHMTLFKGDLVHGIFDEENGEPYAVECRKRLHVIGLVVEETYAEGELEKEIWWFANPFIPDSVERIQALGFGRIMPLPPVRTA